MYSKAPSGPTYPHESLVRLTLTCWCLRAEKVEPVGGKQQNRRCWGSWKELEGDKTVGSERGGSKQSSERLERRAGRRCPIRGGVCQEAQSEDQECWVKGDWAALIRLLLLVASAVNGIPPGGGSAQRTPLFETYSDWDREIKRTGASGWRVCCINEGYMISTW